MFWAYKLETKVQCGKECRFFCLLSPPFLILPTFPSLLRQLSYSVLLKLTMGLELVVVFLCNVVKYSTN